MSGPRTQDSGSIAKPSQAGARGARRLADAIKQALRSAALRSRNIPFMRIVGRKVYNRLPLTLQDRLRRLTQRPIASHAVELLSADELSARGHGFYDELRQAARGVRAR